MSEPLIVTSIGIDLAAAAAEVKRMHGEYRVPSLLRAVDQLARRLEIPDCIGPAG